MSPALTAVLITSGAWVMVTISVGGGLYRLGKRHGLGDAERARTNERLERIEQRLEVDSEAQRSISRQTIDTAASGVPDNNHD